MDDFYEEFVENFGVGTQYEAITDEFLSKYESIFPDGLLEFWRKEGWSSYADGLVWTVNPDKFAWVVDGWVRAVPEMPVDSKYFIIARSAFGNFYCLSLDSKKIFSISCPDVTVVASKDCFVSAPGSAELAAGLFFSLADTDYFDYDDENQSPLFERALERLGPLAHDECYGFVPLLSLGGVASLDHLEKVRMDVHIDIIRQSADIQLYVM